MTILEVINKLDIIHNQIEYFKADELETLETDKRDNYGNKYYATSKEKYNTPTQYFINHIISQH